MSQTELVIYADGGCKGQHSKTAEREAYCSIAAFVGDRPITFSPDWIKEITGLDCTESKQILSRTLPKVSTSPHAEFAAMNTAIRYIAAVIRRNTGKAMPTIKIRMDSEQVVQSFNGERKVKAKHLAALFVPAMTAFARANDHTPVEIEWIDGDTMKSVLGH